MEIRNTRKQQPVGQGFFHTADLRHQGDVTLRYVYDCGAVKKYLSALKKSVKSFVSDTGAHSRLELLFISHAHFDHISGLPDLLDKKKGLAVDTIVLPYFDVVDRLIEFTKSTHSDTGARGNEFYQAFVVDPVAALAQFRPRQIVLLSPGRSGPDGPFFDGGPEFRGPEISGPQAVQERPLWKLVGRGQVQVGVVNDMLLARMSDQIGLVAPSHTSGTIAWLLSPYIDPAISSQSTKFKAELLKSLNASLPTGSKIKKGDFQNWLDNPENVRDLVINKVIDLVNAFHAITSNLNTTSMCLYSGPLPDETGATSFAGQFGRWTVTGGDRIAWLATGDADLKTKSRRAPFLKHYRRLISKVSTLTIPHHGSEKNFDIELITKIDPEHFVVAADQFSNWRHPGTSVVQAIGSHGRFLSVVTSDSDSLVTEFAQLRA
jgi:hypothetical protein